MLDGIIYKQAGNSNIALSIVRAKQFIHQNYAASISLEAVSSHVSFSPSYFSNCFTQENGKSFRQYLFDVRMDEAKKLLLSGVLNVADVAKKVGFGDVKYFYKAFKKETSIPPGKYRSQTRRKD